jgi:dTDP-4-dehydrorhamnose reductase
MRYLITGANGQVGHALSQLTSAQKTLIALSHAELDITDLQAIKTAIIHYRPAVIINAAAYTAVDKAEQEMEQAFMVNAQSPRLLAKACAITNIPLIHLSTDYVFNGSQQRPYQESDTVNPLNSYGASKWAGEQAVQEFWHKHIILRLSGVFSAHGHNFVKTILRLAQERETLNIVADQITCPTSAQAIAQTILIIAEKVLQNDNYWGTYHYASSPPTSWYNFAKKIVSLAEINFPIKTKIINAITTAEYPTPAKRPAYSVLDSNKLKLNFAINPSFWEIELAETLRILAL